MDDVIALTPTAISRILLSFYPLYEFGYREAVPGEKKSFIKYYEPGESHSSFGVDMGHVFGCEILVAAAENPDMS